MESTNTVGTEDAQAKFHERELAGYTNAYRALVPECEAEGRTVIFDPSLKGYVNGYRVGDPEFTNADDQRVWNEARRRVADYLLHLVTTSVWNDHLVLRGSMLQQAYLGDAAREPGDIDWVFQPSDVSSSDARAESLTQALIRVATNRPQVGDITLQTDRISVDGIWTYDRAEGRRIVFPWKVAELPIGYVQMDIVFGEPLPMAPVPVAIPLLDGKHITAWAATRELSLAWKLLWLMTDSYPQGKDLYDAVLLAEQTFLPFDLLYRVVQAADEYLLKYLGPDFTSSICIDDVDLGENSLLREEDVEEWLARLSAALTPTFAGH